MPPQKHAFKNINSYLKPALGHEEVVFDALLPKLLQCVQTHRSILIIDFLFVLITEDGVSIVDLLELFSSFWVVWVLIRVMPQCQFPEYKKVLEHEEVFDFCLSFRR